MLGRMLTPTAVGGSDQQMGMGWSFQDKQVENVGFTIGDRDQLDLWRHHLLGLS